MANTGKRHPSEKLCAELAGDASDGSVIDRADWIAQAIEQAEDPAGAKTVPPGERVSVGDALVMIYECREILDRAEARLRELGDSVA